MAKLVLLNKPFNVLSQFTDREGSDNPHIGARSTLADFISTRQFANFYPAGRLDYDSEGLLLLTDNGALQHRIAHPTQKLEKTYWVQVEGKPEEAAISTLTRGVDLKDGRTRPAKVRLLEAEPALWPRTPPIRHRPSIPTSWLEIKIGEGRNRQVRRMTAAVGLPTLRLVRCAIGDWRLDHLLPGEFRVETVHLPPAAEAQKQGDRARAGRKKPRAAAQKKAPSRRR